MEEWKEIPGYEGLYEASNMGRIRTVAGKTTSNARYSKRIWKQRIMKEKYKKRKDTGVKDAMLSLWKDGSCKTWLVSRLIAFTWCDGYKYGFTVNHKDGNPLNNRCENLEWVSFADNIRHAFENGLMPCKSCVLISESGEKKYFRSYAQASISIGRNEGYISNCIANNRSAIASNGERYGIA